MYVLGIICLKRNHRRCRNRSRKIIQIGWEGGGGRGLVATAAIGGNRHNDSNDDQHDEDTADRSSAPPARKTQLLPPQPSIVWVLWVHFVKTLCVCVAFGFQTSISVIRAYLVAWGVGQPNLHPVQVVRVARRLTTVQGCVWGVLSYHVSGGDAEILDPNHADAVGVTRLCGYLDGQRAIRLVRSFGAPSDTVVGSCHHCCPGEVRCKSQCNGHHVDVSVSGRPPRLMWGALGGEMSVGKMMGIVSVLVKSVRGGALGSMGAVVTLRTNRQSSFVRVMAAI